MAIKIHYFTHYEVYGAGCVVLRGSLQQSMTAHNAPHILKDLHDNVRTLLEKDGVMKPHMKLIFTCVSVLYSEQVNDTQTEVIPSQTHEVGND